jgi:methionyl-tRNA synthetase
MPSKFFITTPIYYSNGIPHIGHAYSSLIADTLANYHLLRWDDVKFLTGVDENSQKVVESATEKGIEIMEYADMMALEHQKIWDGLVIHYTTFVRTATPVHHTFVQQMLQRSYDAGDIYEWIYEGLYCVGCEAFKKESDLVAGKCPDHPNKSLEHLKEKNYFFRLSRYQDRLLQFYESHPEFITPSNRFAEILEFVRGWLEDFSVSRETNKFGIPLPFDPSQVTYVWYDALFNYLTYCQEDEEKWWPADIHVIGKDIARFHGVYWPAMLWSAGYETPSQLLVTGHFTVNGQKMSKTIGNVIDPVSWCEKYSRDALLLYLFTAFPIGQDGDFDEHEAILQYNAKLANNIGNLLNRIIALSLKIWGTISGIVW